MASNPKKVGKNIDSEKKKQAEKTLMDIAQETQQHVQKMLPQGSFNRDQAILNSLNKKVLGVFNQSMPKFNEMLADADVETPGFVKDKMLACKREFLRIGMRKFLQVAAAAQLKFSENELEVLPSFCAEILRRMFFESDRIKFSESSNIYKMQEDVASVLGAGNCGDMVACGHLYLLRHYRTRLDLFPMCGLHIMNPQDINNPTKNDLAKGDLLETIAASDGAHMLLILNYDAKNPKDPNKKTVYCDFWINKTADSLKKIVQALPEPLCTYAYGGGAVCIPMPPISQEEIEGSMAANPYEGLRPMFHYTIKDMYQLLTVEGFPEKFYLVDESQHPRPEDLYDTTLSAEEKKALAEWHATWLKKIGEISKVEKQMVRMMGMLGFSSAAQNLLMTGVAAPEPAAPELAAPQPAASKAVAAAEPGKGTKKKKRRSNVKKG